MISCQKRHVHWEDDKEPDIYKNQNNNTKTQKIKKSSREKRFDNKESKDEPILLPILSIVTSSSISSIKPEITPQIKNDEPYLTTQLKKKKEKEEQEEDELAVRLDEKMEMAKDVIAICGTQIFKQCYKLWNNVQPLWSSVRIFLNAVQMLSIRGIRRIQKYLNDRQELWKQAQREADATLAARYARRKLFQERKEKDAKIKAAAEKNNNCIICYTEPRTHSFSCGHFCICQSCSSKLRELRCPICRCAGTPFLIYY